MGYKKISKDLKRKILKEVEETKEVTSVAKKYGVDPSSIFKWKKYGIEAKRREYTKEFRKQVVKEKVVYRNVEQFMEYRVILLDSGKMNWWKKSKKRFDKADSKRSNMNEDLFT